MLPFQRVAFVDASRGIAVMAMLAANLVNVCLRQVPDALSHNQGDVLRPFDLPAPIFQLLVGVSLPLYLAARRAIGRSSLDARLDAVRRFALLILLGMALDAVGKLSLVPGWGVLQTLGLGGAVATVLSGAPSGVRAAAAVVLLGLFSGAANGVVHTRPDAAFAFVPLTLAGTFIGDAIATGAPPEAVARRAAAIAAIAAAVGLTLHADGIGFNKVLGTSSFVTLATAVGAVLLATTAWWEARAGGIPRGLLVVGRNALTTWVLLHLLVYYPAWLVFPSWERLPLGEGLVAVTLATGALCLSTAALARRGLRIAL